MLAACSSFGAAPSSTDASVGPDATPPGDGATDASADSPGDGSPDAFSTDAAAPCRTVVVDDFNGNTPNPSWRLDPPAGKRDFSSGRAALSIPQGEGLYSVLASEAFKGPGEPTPPQRVSIDFDIVSSQFDIPGVTVAQLPGLTDGGNIRIDAVPRLPDSGRPGMSLMLVPNGQPSPSPLPTLDFESGEVAKIRLTYERAGNGVSVTVSLRDRTGTLSAKTTTSAQSDAAYFQMGPFSDRGPLLSAGATIVYDNVNVQACAR
jgi:hypothetical protein